MATRSASPLRERIVDELAQRTITRVTAATSSQCHPPTRPHVRTMACDEMNAWAHAESEERLRRILRESGYDESYRLVNDCVGGVRILPTLTYSVLHDAVVERVTAWCDAQPRRPSFELATAPRSIGECGICLGERERLVELPCRHRFGRACVRRWLARSPTCPTCRAVVPIDAPLRRHAKRTGT